MISRNANPTFSTRCQRKAVNAATIKPCAAHAQTWPHKHVVENHTQPRSNTKGERGGCRVGGAHLPDKQTRPPA